MRLISFEGLLWNSELKNIEHVPMAKYASSPPQLKLTLPWRGSFRQEGSTQVHQQEELVGVLLIRPIRTNRSL